MRDEHEFGKPVPYVKWSLKLASYFLFKFLLSKKIKNQKKNKSNKRHFRSPEGWAPDIFDRILQATDFLPDSAAILRNSFGWGRREA